MVTRHPYPFFLFAIILICQSIACRTNNRVPDGRLQEVKPGLWQTSLEPEGDVSIRCIVFPKSIRTLEEWKKQRERCAKWIAEIREGLRSASTESIRQMYEEEKTLVTYVGGWKGWSQVFVRPLILEQPGNLRTVVIAHNKQREVDMAFLVENSTGEITRRQIIEQIHDLTKILDKMSTSQFKQLPFENISIYKKNGAWQSAALLKFTENTVFLRQH